MTLNFLKGVGNEHFEITRLGLALSIVAGVVFSGIHLIRDHVFSIIEFGVGLGGLIAGGAGGSAIKTMAAAKVTAAQGDAA